MLIVDRIEGGFAVCEQADRTMITLPLGSLPPNLREGDCIQDENGRYVIDAVETNRRRAANQALLRSLLHKDE